MKKLLLFDVDGTLVSYDGVVPQSCVDALKKARENGHLVYIVTGRMRNRALVGGIEADGMICGNGAYIETDGKVLKDCSLTKEQVAEITSYLDEKDIPYFMEGNNGLYGSHGYAEKAVLTYVRYGIENPDIHKLYPMMEFPEDMVQSGVTKINYILPEYSFYETFRNHFSSLQCLTWGGKGEEALFGDCALPGIDKQVAIRELVEELGISRENTFAFGDANVDIPMFAFAGTSVCMGSGGEEAKKCADYVTADVKEDGIAKALKHFGLIGE